MKTTTFLITVVSLCALASNVRSASFPSASVTDGICVEATRGLREGPSDAENLRKAGVSCVRVAFYFDPQTYELRYDGEYTDLVSYCATKGLRVFAIVSVESLCVNNSGVVVDPDVDPTCHYIPTADELGSPDFRNAFKESLYQTVYIFTEQANQLQGAETTNSSWNPNFTWELWNEPNRGFWPGHSVDDYMKLAMGDPTEAFWQGALDVMRQAIADAGGDLANTTVIGPAVALPKDWETLGQYFPDGIDYLGSCISSPYGNLLSMVDGISVHPYVLSLDFEGDLRPEKTLIYYDGIRAKIRDTIQDYDNTPPIVAGEWGYASTAVGEQSQADYLQRRILIDFSEHIPLTTWYRAVDLPPSLDDPGESYGLFRPTISNGSPFKIDGDPKPSFYAMKTLTSALKGATFSTQMGEPLGVNWLSFDTPSSRGPTQILAAWTTGDPTVAWNNDWGSYVLTQTPLYVGENMHWRGGIGNWSDLSWAVNNGTVGVWPNVYSAWPNDDTYHDSYQAVFAVAGDTAYLNDGEYYVSGLQFNAPGVMLDGGKLRFTPGGGNLYAADGVDYITSELADTVDWGSDPLNFTNTAETFVLRKSGGGEVGLFGTNTFHGGVLVGQGFIYLGSDQALGDDLNPLTLAGGSIDFYGHNLTTGPFAIIAAGPPIGNWLSNTSSQYTFPSGRIDQTVTVAGSGNLTLAGPISGAGGLNKTEAGMLTLNNSDPNPNSDYSGGTTINGGMLFFATIKSLPSTGSVTINSGGSLAAAGAYGGVSPWIASGRINTGSSGALLLDIDTSGINLSTGGYNKLYIGSWGSHTLGTLTPGENGYLLGGGNGILTVESRLTGSNDLSVHGNVILNNTDTQSRNNYSGSTTINPSGTLTISGSGLINTGSILINGGALYQDSTTALARTITMENGGTLGGTGSVSASLSVVGGHVSPGSSGHGSIGTLSAGSSVGFSGGSSFDVDLSSTLYDALAMTGMNRALTPGGATLNVFWRGTLPIPATSWHIITGAASRPTTSFTLGTVPSGRAWSVSFVRQSNGYYDAILRAT